MTLYEINNAIYDCIDEETGEIIDFDMIEALELERNQKIENLGLWYKNLLADSNALKNEIDVLTERKKQADSKAEQIKAWLTDILAGGKFETSKIKMFYRKSKAVDVDEDFIEWAKQNNDELLSYKEPTPNKTAIKTLILSGVELLHAKISEKNNLNIK